MSGGGAIRGSRDQVAISEAKKTGAFTLPGIGKMVLSKRKARMGRNPAISAEIKIPTKTVVMIRVAKAAKDAIVPSEEVAPALRVGPNAVNLSSLAVM